MPSLQRKIQLGYYAFAGAVAGIALLAYSDLSYLERNIAPDVAASRLLDAVLEIRRYEKNWFLYGGAEALAEVEAYAEQAQGLIAEARPTLTELGGPRELERLDADLAAYRRLLAGVGEAARNGDQAPEIRQTGRRLSDAAEGLAHARHTRLQEVIAQSRAALLAAGALAILLAVAAAQWLAGRTTRPLGLLVEQLRDIADGRYDQVTPVSQDREILAVSSAVNRMLAELDARRRHLVQAEKLASLGTLVSGVAHELNNPLSNVSSSCQILAEELATAGQAQVREWLGQIDTETERARNIVRTLLEFSREGAFRKRRLALRPLVEQTLRLVGPATKRGAEGASLDVDVPEGLTVEADPQRLQQVLVNLIRNALEAGGPEVRVTVSAHLRDAAGFQMPDHSVCGRSEAPAAVGARLVLITVADSGPGIAPEVLPRVFDPFFTTKDVGHGSGLGLYVSQEIVHQHGGCIGVSSRPGERTRFLIALPCTQPGGVP